MCTRMFIATLLIVALNWKFLECPQMGKCLNKYSTHPYHRIVRSNNKEHTIDTCKSLDKPQRNYAK